MTVVAPSWLVPQLPPKETRRLFASVLGMEGIVLWLAIIVAAVQTSVPLGLALGVGGALALAAFVLSGMLRHRWAYLAGSILQVLAVLSGFVVPMMFILGAVFGVLWIGAFRMGRLVSQ